MERGLVHIYCGDGKGKTTAAVGLAIRCAGCGGRVLYTSFFKDNKSGELTVLRKIPEIELIENHQDIKFFKFMNDEEKLETKILYKERLADIKERLDDSFDMLVLDEVIPTVNNGIFDETKLIDLINNKPPMTEIVLTGRCPSDRLLALADYVSEIKKIKHPYDRGICARKMIEM